MPASNTSKQARENNYINFEPLTRDVPKYFFLLISTTNKHTRQALTSKESLAGNKSESLNFHESTMGISMSNQCRINIIQVLRWFKAVMQEDEIFQMKERNPHSKFTKIVHHLITESEYERRRMRKEKVKET